MSQTTRSILGFALICVGYAVVLLAQPPIQSEGRERTTFCADDESFNHASLPTDDVLDALLRTSQAKVLSGELEKLDREERRKLFRSVPVHLTGSDQSDYLVLGKPPMSGADNDWFWIVRRGLSRTEVVLEAGGNCLELLKKRSDGYKDIRAMWGAASGLKITWIYNYDGAQYRLAHKYTKTVSPTQ
jgi:hypothetical protein